MLATKGAFVKNRPRCRNESKYVSEPFGMALDGGLLQKIPRHLFSSGSAEQPHVAANVGVKAAICQQKRAFVG